MQKEGNLVLPPSFIHDNEKFAQCIFHYRLSAVLMNCLLLFLLVFMYLAVHSFQNISSYRLLIAVTSASMDALIISVSRPAPQARDPSGLRIPT